MCIYAFITRFYRVYLCVYCTRYIVLRCPPCEIRLSRVEKKNCYSFQRFESKFNTPKTPPRLYPSAFAYFHYNVIDHLYLFL